MKAKRPLTSSSPISRKTSKRDNPDIDRIAIWWQLPSSADCRY
ncbi:MAG: hypothetical protein ABIJ25_04695 [Pseudomonadota bacterium]